MTTNLESIRIAHSKLPASFRLTLRDCIILFYAEQYRNAPYAQWPRDLKMNKAVDKLRRRRYLHRGYFPTKYNITQVGFSLVRWIRASIEHINTSTASQG